MLHKVVEVIFIVSVVRMRLYVNDNDNDSVDFEGERTFEKFKDFVMEALQDSASSGKKARVRLFVMKYFGLFQHIVHIVQSLIDARVLIGKHGVQFSYRDCRPTKRSNIYSY